MEDPALPLEKDGKRILASRAQLSQLGFPNLSDGQLGSILDIRSPMLHGQYAWDDKGVPDGPILIRVDLRAQTMSVFRAGHEIGTTVILYGADEKPTPVGAFSVLEKRKEHRSSSYGAAMPYMLRLTNDGVAIHGSNVQLGAATHGCVGVPMAFASLLFDEVKAGDEVLVLQSREKVEPSRPGASLKPANG